MNILLAAATEDEIGPLRNLMSRQWIASSAGYTLGNCTVRPLITGVGIHRMAYALGGALAGMPVPDLCINAGIAGAFPGKAQIGDVLHVTREIFADLGAEDRDGNILSLREMGLHEDLSSTEGLVNHDAAQYQFLPVVTGVTVNMTHGWAPSITRIIERFDPDVESMEGAAFFYCCIRAGVPFIAVRAVSNIVEPRNRENWDIERAVQRLCDELSGMLRFFAG